MPFKHETHVVGDEAAGVSEYEPTGHLMKEVKPPVDEQKPPRGQSMHADWAVAPSVYVPSGHGRHAGMVVLGANVPAAQGKHAPIAGMRPSATWPRGQAMQRGLNWSTVRSMPVL